VTPLPSRRTVDDGPGDRDDADADEAADAAVDVLVGYPGNRAVASDAGPFLPAHARPVPVDRPDSLESELERARDLSVPELADAIESIGFDCTRCGACCKGYETDDGREPHTATVFPDEVRRLQAAAGDGRAGGDVDEEGDEGDGSDGGDATGRTDDESTDEEPSGAYDWRDVARPMPYGLREGPEGPEGETFEWALRTDACGDCRFYEEREVDGTTTGACAVHEDRPLVCRTYPFSVALAGTSQPLGEAVDEAGLVRAHECEGLGREIDRADALELARALRERAVRELEEAISLRDAYAPATSGPGQVVVHDSEGAKRPDGRPLGNGAPTNGAHDPGSRPE
jgi:hypothetical protein